MIKVHKIFVTPKVFSQERQKQQETKGEGKERFEIILLKNKEQWESLNDEVATNIMTKGYKPSFRSIPELTLEPPSSVTISQKTITDLKEFIPIWLKREIIREIIVPTPLRFSRIFMSFKKERGKSDQS